MFSEEVGSRYTVFNHAEKNELFLRMEVSNIYYNILLAKARQDELGNSSPEMANIFIPFPAVPDSVL